VVNEAIADNGSLRPSVWNSIPNLFEKAFLWTHEANPYARLYWNDYRPCVTPKWDKTLQVIDELRDIAIPIHGVGIQHHYHLRRFLVEKITNWVSTRSLVEQIKHRSLRVAFTEVSVLDDIGMPWLKDKALEELYAIAQELDVSSFTLWHCCESFRR
jgi:endo-1,4-beta-xylanase